MRNSRAGRCSARGSRLTGRGTNNGRLNRSIHSSVESRQSARPSHGASARDASRRPRAEDAIGAEISEAVALTDQVLLPLDQRPFGAQTEDSINRTRVESYGSEVCWSSATVRSWAAIASTISVKTSSVLRCSGCFGPGRMMP